VLNRFGKVNSIDRVEIGPGSVAIDHVNLEMKHDGMAIIKLRMRVDANLIPEPLILVVEGGKIRRADTEETLSADSAR
jgi:hypothetical protein